MNINCTQLNAIYVYREQQVSRLHVLRDKLIENNELPCRMRTFCHMSNMLKYQNSMLRTKGDNK